MASVAFADSERPLQNPIKDGLNLAPYAAIMPDTREGLGIDAVRQRSDNGEFSSVGEADDYTLQIGFSDVPYWIRVSPPAALRTSNTPWYLRLGYYYRNDIRVFINGEERWHTGNLQPVESRPIFDTQYVFPIQPLETRGPIYIRVDSAQNLNLRLVAWSPSGFTRHAAEADALQFTYAGAMALLISFNLLFGIALRDRNFLVYCLFTASIAAAMLGGNGYLRLYIWPDAMLWDQVSEQVFYASMVALGILLSRSFLSIPPRYAWIDHVLTVSLGIAAVVVSVTLYGWLVPGQLISLNAIGIPLLWITAAVIILRSVLAYRSGQREARFLIVAWTALWLGISVATGWSYGVVPSSLFTVHAGQFGSIAEAVFLSLALGERVLKVRQGTAYTEAALAEAERYREKQSRVSELVSHEFRNPLAIARNQLYLLHRRGELTDSSIQRLGSAQSAVERLTRLVDQWFRSHRLLQAELKLDPEVLDLGHWIEQQRERLVGCFPDSSLAFHCHENVLVRGEPGLLETALFNLIDNACKYSPAGCPVDIRVHTANGQARISVDDQGSGLSSAEKEAIFQDFYRQPGPNQPPGLGLGLTLVAEVMRHHRGAVEVTDRLGGGSTFTLVLPMVKE